MKHHINEISFVWLKPIAKNYKSKEFSEITGCNKTQWVHLRASNSIEDYRVISKKKARKDDPKVDPGVNDGIAEFVDMGKMEYNPGLASSVFALAKVTDSISHMGKEIFEVLANFAVVVIFLIGSWQVGGWIFGMLVK